MNKYRTDSNAERIKLEATLSTAPFKTAFKATLGFYLAQLLITVVGISVIGLVILTIAWLM